MKKLLVLSLSTMMTLSAAAAAMATVDLSGEMTMTYNTEDKADSIEASLKASSKINDVVSATVGLKANNLDNTTSTKSNFWCDQAYTTITQPFGEFKFGQFDYKTYNTKLIDNGNSAIGKLKNAFAVGYTSSPVAGGFTVGGVYFANENRIKEYDSNETFDDDAYVVSFGYKNDFLDTSIHYANGLVTTLEPNKTQDAYAFNATAKLSDELSVWGQYGSNKNEKKNAIIGGEVKFDQAYLQAEYDIFDKVTPDFNRYAYRLGYDFENGTKLEYRYKELKDGDKTPEIRLITSFK